MHLDLTKEEAALLRELLDHAHLDLREEVYKTEAATWKRALKDREHILEGLVAKVAALA
jgi:DNA gyrase/topoisomerase IV subunit A